MHDQFDGSEPETARMRDAALLARMREGDADAFTALVRAYYSTMLSIAGTIVGSSASAQDAVQNVCMRLWSSRMELQITGDVRGYLWRAVQNEARLLIRREGVRQRYADEVQHASAMNPLVATNSAPATLEREELVRQIDAVVAVLPRRCRDIFLLYWRDDLTAEEIAAVFGIHHRTVQNQIAFAFRALAKQLRTQGSG